MTPAYATWLGLVVKSTNISTQKIDDLFFETYKMAIAGFILQDKQWKAWFFDEIFLLADTSMEIVLGIFFLCYSQADIWFAEKELV